MESFVFLIIPLKLSFVAFGVGARPCERKICCETRKIVHRGKLLQFHCAVTWVSMVIRFVFVNNRRSITHKRPLPII